MSSKCLLDGLLSHCTKDTSNNSMLYDLIPCRIVSSDVYNLPVVVDSKLEPGYLDEAAKVLDSHATANFYRLRYII
jgi:hypothetical protein